MRLRGKDGRPYNLPTRIPPIQTTNDAWNHPHTKEYVSSPLSASRFLEDVEYWRHRAGWFDDDVSMKAYNTGVYSTVYGIDDDGGSHRKSNNAFRKKDIMHTMATILGAFVAILVLVQLIKAGTATASKSRQRGRSSQSLSSSSDAQTGHRSRSRSKPRSRSKSISRSASRSASQSRRSSSRSRSKSRTRSRSRAPPPSHSDGDYALLDDESMQNRSSRSKSRTRSNSQQLEPMLV